MLSCKFSVLEENNIKAKQPFIKGLPVQYDRLRKWIKAQQSFYIPYLANIDAVPKDRAKHCLWDESIVYNRISTIYNRSAASSVEKVHW